MNFQASFWVSLCLLLFSAAGFAQETQILILHGKSDGIEEALANTRDLALLTFGELGIPKENILEIRPFQKTEFKDYEDWEKNHALPQIKKALLELKKNKKENTRLLVLPLSHGEQVQTGSIKTSLISGGLTEDPLFPQRLGYDELAQQVLSTHENGKNFLLVPQCFSGYAVEDPDCQSAFHGIFAASKANDVSWTSDRLPHIEKPGKPYHGYLYFFLSALRKKFPDGTSITSADTNQNGTTDLDEAHDFASKQLLLLGKDFSSEEYPTPSLHSLPSSFLKEGETDFRLCETSRPACDGQGASPSQTDRKKPKELPQEESDSETTPTPTPQTGTPAR